VRTLLDFGYKKPEEDVDAIDEMAVEPYIDHGSNDDDDDDDSSSQPRVLSSSSPRQVFALGRKLAGRKSMEKHPAAKPKHPAKIHGKTVDLFTLLVAVFQVISFFYVTAFLLLFYCWMLFQTPAARRLSHPV